MMNINTSVHEAPQSAHEDLAANSATERGFGRAKPASYPAVSLSLCLKKARAMIEAQGREQADRYQSAKTLARLAGYKGFENNSAPKGFLAALSHFGLLEKDPGTREARLARELRELDWSNEAQLAAVVARAMRRPSIHQAALREFGATRMPERDELRAFLVRKGLSERPASVLAACMLDDWALAASCGAAKRLDRWAREEGSERSMGDAPRASRRVQLPSGNEASISFAEAPSESDWIALQQRLTATA
jgi:hypothetical protein